MRPAVWLKTNYNAGDASHSQSRGKTNDLALICQLVSIVIDQTLDKTANSYASNRPSPLGTAHYSAKHHGRMFIVNPVEWVIVSCAAVCCFANFLGEHIYASLRNFQPNLVLAGL